MAKHRIKTGLSPGSIIFTGSQKMEQVKLTVCTFNVDSVKEDHLDHYADLSKYSVTENSLMWVDIRGLHETDGIEAVGKKFTIHPLVLEDTVDTFQRAKYASYEKGHFLLLKAMSFDAIKKKAEAEQVSIYFGKNFLVTFQENESDLFKSIRDRLVNNLGRVRKKGSDYLAYALVDNIVDHYFHVLDAVEAAVEKIEDNIIEKPDAKHKTDIHLLKKELIFVRKSVAPLREAIRKMMDEDHHLIEESTGIYLRDLYGHTVQVLEMSETYRDMLNGLQELYLSEISFKMNQIMQVLTVFSVFFIPLSFLVGLYGMNFKNMPELELENGYFILLGVMFCVTILLFVFFKMKKWF